MRNFTLYRLFENFFAAFHASWRRRIVESKSQQVGTYRYSTSKPSRLGNGGFALFYRNRTAWLVAQFLVYGALALWTFKNYIEVIRSL
jgi:hypothetical protein